MTRTHWDDFAGWLTQRLAEQGSHSILSSAVSLSTRQLLRIARLLEVVEKEKKKKRN